MLNMQEIHDTIHELEQGDTTFDSCSKLASLYIVRQHYKPNEIPQETNEISLNLNIGNATSVRKELSDILPHYDMYCNLKGEYQMGKIAKEPVIQAFTSVCNEISEFIHTLYSSVDMQEERDMLDEMVGKLHI